MTDDDNLDDLFAAARTPVGRPSAMLMARVLADADALQPGPRDRPRPVARRSWVATLVAALGGGGAMAGLATAMAAGLWIGLAQPAPVATLSQTLWPATEEDSLDLLPDMEGMMTDAEG